MGILDRLKNKIKEAGQVAKDTLSDACCDEEIKIAKEEE